MDATANSSKRPNTWKKNPDPASEPELARQRKRQWRPISLNPFQPQAGSTDASSKQGEGSNDNAVGEKPRMTSWGSGNTVVKDGEISEFPQPLEHERLQPKLSLPDASKLIRPIPDKHSEIKHPELKHTGSSWVHLFNDLAWAASFASLTGGGKFDNPLDTMNYLYFCVAVSWLWISHTLYSIHFYTDDWFHLMSTCLHLFIFVMLASTTKGYDITNYIAHSPGMPTLRGNNNMDNLSPQEYTEEMTDHLSMLVLAMAFAATRIIQLVQYIRVLCYSGSTEPNPENQNTMLRNRSCSWISRLPPQLVAITIGLLISNPMFIAALGLAASESGLTVFGASLKSGLWMSGFLIEVISHLSMPTYWWMKNQDITTINPSDLKKRILPTASDVKLYERLQTITAIIIGEGVNGIGHNLSTVLATPGIKGTAVVNIVSAACTIWFVAYISFEGPKGEMLSRLTSLRYLFWLILYIPLLASTMLMLIGMKSQLLLTTFLSAFFESAGRFNRILYEQLIGSPNITSWRTNPVMKHFLLERGIVWEDEFYKFMNASINATNTGEYSMVMSVWSQRMSLTIALKLFEGLNGEGDSIPSDLQDIITAYYENSTQVIEDLKIMPTHPEDAVYYQILGGLLDGSIFSARCVIGFAGMILISLGLRDFIHSWPSDRYQWGVITSRISMGIILCSLLLLNIGKYQDLFVAVDKRNQRAGVFQWLEAFWVLPTIAIAYGLEYLVEMALARFAKWATIVEEKKTTISNSNNNPKDSQVDSEKQQQV